MQPYIWGKYLWTSIHYISLGYPENPSKEEQNDYLGKSMESGGGKRGILRRLSMDDPSLTLENFVGLYQSLY